jgi:hypothetical protein
MELKQEETSYAAFIKRVRDAYGQLWKAMAIQEKGDGGSLPNMEGIEEAVREELSRATGQPIEQIDIYLLHGEYLTEDCLMKLRERGAGEDFFVEAQHLKVILIKNALVKGQGREEISREISAAILDMHREYQETQKVNAMAWLRNQIESSDAEPTWASGMELFRKPQILRYKPPKGGDLAQKSLTPAEIGARLEELAKRIREIAQRRTKSNGNLAQNLGRLTIEMAKVHQEALDQSVSVKEKKQGG